MEDNGGGVMRCIESGRARMRIEESMAKNQGSIDLGMDVVVGVRGGGARRTPLGLIMPP